MKRLFKILAWLVGGIVALLAIAAVALPLLLDPNSHKQRIAEEIEARTGLPARIAGDIDLTLFPWLGATVGAVELGQAPGFEGDTFARVESLRVRVKLLPLLSQQLEMDTVIIEGLRLDLARSASGAVNWQPILDATAAGEGMATKEDGPPPIAVLAIGGLEVSNAAVRWRDALAGQNYAVSNLGLSTGPLDLSQPVPVSLAFSVVGGEPALEGRVTLNTALLLLLEQNQVRAEELMLEGDFSRTGPVGGAGKLAIAGDVAVDLDARTLAVATLELNADMAEVTALGGAAKVALRGDLVAAAEVQAASLSGMRLDADLGRVAALGGPARLQLAGDLRVDGGGERVRIAGMKLDADVAGDVIPGGKAKVVASGELDADLAGGYVQIAGLESELSQLAMLGASAGLRLAGDFRGDLGAAVYELAGGSFSGLMAGYPAADSRVPFNGAAGLKVDAGQQRFEVNQLELNVPDFRLTALGGALELATSVQGDYGRGRYVAEQLKLGGRLAGDALGGDLDFSLGTGVDADLASGLVKLPGFGIRGSMSGAQVPEGSQPFDLAANLGANLRGQQLEIGRLRATIGPMKASGDLTVSELLVSPNYRGTLSLARFNPRTLMQMFNQPAPDTADPKALTAAELSAGISGNLAQIALDPLDLTLDGQRARGRLQVVNFDYPAYRFDLAVDRLDADRYLPPASPAATPGAAAGAAAGLPAETLRALDAQGQLRIGALRISNLTLSDIAVTLTGKGGLVQLSPLGARLYGGSYRGNVTLDARGQLTQVSVDEELAGVQLGPLLRDLKNLDTLSGRADVRLRANATGADMDAIVRTLNGDTAFRISDGEFRGMDLAGRLCGLVAGGLGGFQSGEGGSTRFSDLTGTATVSNGVVTNPDFLARSPLLRIDGRGQANLVTEQLDYTATANLVSSCQGQGGLNVGDLSRIPVPVRVTGSFSRPQYGLDTAALVQGLAKTKLREKLQQSLGLPTQQAPAPVQQGQQALPPPEPVDPKKQAIEGLLKGLFGN